MYIIERQCSKNKPLSLAVSPMIKLICSMTFDIFGNFLMEISKTVQQNDEPHIFLYDNMSSHLNPINFRDQGEIMYLLKYSLAEMTGLYQSIFEESNGNTRS